MGKCNCTPIVLESGDVIHKVDCPAMTPSNLNYNAPQDSPDRKGIAEAQKQSSPSNAELSKKQLKATLIRHFRHGELDLENASKEIVELFDNKAAQEANKARLETMQKVSDRLDDLHQGTEGAGWVHYGEMGEWLDDEISRLTAEKGSNNG